MRSGRLNRIFSSRVFYIVFAIIAAAALWIYVEYDDPRDQSFTIDIPVVVSNETLLHDRRLLVTQIYPRTVSVTFVGPRTAFLNLSPTTVYAEVNVGGIHVPDDDISLGFDIRLPSGVNQNLLSDISSPVDRINITVERLAERAIPVRGVYEGGTAAPEYIAGAPDFNPQTIIVYGPESVLSTISEAWVPIMRENLSSTYVNDLPFVLRDEYGEELGSQQLELIRLSQQEVRVTVQISMIRDVALHVERIHGAGTTDQNTVIEIYPQTISVSGDPEEIREMNRLTLGTINLNDIELMYTEIFAIPVPNDVVNHSGVAEAIVSVTIRDLEVEGFLTSNIRLQNAPDDLEVELITTVLNVRIRGTREELDALTDTNIRVVVNLADVALEPDVVGRTVTVTPTIFLDGDVGDIGPVGQYTVTIAVSRQ